MKQQVLVTGAAGFTGSKLVHELPEKNFEVYAFVRRHSDLARLKGTKAQIIYGDLRDKASVENAVRKVNIIYHIGAAWQHYSLSDQDYFDINVQGTKNLLDAARKYNIIRFVHTSTVGVLGDVRQIPATEKTPYNPGYVYQYSKVEGEKLALQYYKNYKLPVVVIRPSGIYGPGDMRFVRLYKGIQNKRFVMIGKGDKLYHLTYIDDLIQGYILAGTSNSAIGQVYIIADDHAVTMNQLVQIIAKQLHVEPPRLHLPLLPVIVGAWICEKACQPFNLKPFISVRRLDPFRKHRSFDISKAKKELKYQPRVSLEEGIKRTIQWCKEQNLLK